MTELVRPELLATFSSGTYAGRPAAGVPGREYFATDVAGGAVFRDTGTAWAFIGACVGVTLSSVTTFNGTSQAASTDVSLGSFSTIPGGFMAVGTTFRLTVGLDSDILNSATARNLVFKIKAGATVLLTATLAVLISVANTNKASFFDSLIVCHTTGASGVIRTQAIMDQVWGSAATPDRLHPETSAVAGVTLDTTAAQAITFTVNESVNSVADLVRSETGSFVLVKQ